MKTFLTINIFLLFLSGCSYDNAFSRFDISPERAKSEEGIVSAKIYDKESVIGVITCLHLNSVDPKKYKDGEYFYIDLYTKDKKASLNFTLNDTNTTFVKELTIDNEFAILTNSSTVWKKYYLLKFDKQEGTLTLRTKIADFTSTGILFKKDY